MNVKAKYRLVEAARSIVVFGALAVILLTIPLYAETDERELYAEAESFYYGRNYSLALESFSKFVDRFPFSALVPDAQYRRAVCLFRLKRYDEALSLFARIGRSRPFFTLSLCKSIPVERIQWAAAIAAAPPAPVNAPNDIDKRGVKELHPPVPFDRGWAFYRTEKTAEAAPLFQTLRGR